MNFIKDFKEVFYDLIGYVLPGFIALVILLIPIYAQSFTSPVYALISILNSKSTVFSLNLSSLPSLSIFIIFIASYLIGHFLKGLCDILSNHKFVKFSTKNIKLNVDKKYAYLDRLKNNCFDLIRNDTLFSNNVFNSNDNNNLNIDKNLVITYASTISRFSNHSNLIQKYISKINLYSSLSCISFLLICDTIISSIIITFNFSYLKYNSRLTTLVLISIFIIFCIFFKSFFKEFYRHIKLKEKECYFFILDYNNSNLSVSRTN